MPKDFFISDSLHCGYRCVSISEGKDEQSE